MSFDESTYKLSIIDDPTVAGIHEMTITARYFDGVSPTMVETHDFSVKVAKKATSISPMF